MTRIGKSLQIGLNSASKFGYADFYGAPIVNLLFVANIVIFEWFIWLYEITRLVTVNTQSCYIK